MRTYYFIVTLIAVIGVSLVFANYPVIIGIGSLSLGIGYQYYYPDEDKDDDDAEVLED